MFEDPIFYVNVCFICKYMQLGTENRFMRSCSRCLSANSCTPPTPIYVPGHYRFTDDAGYIDGYSPSISEMDTAIADSFEEERDPEPKPASEQTNQAMKRWRCLEDEKCGICLETIVAGLECIVTPCCKKKTHIDCMENSLVVIPCCPFCRWSANS